MARRSRQPPAPAMTVAHAADSGDRTSCDVQRTSEHLAPRYDTRRLRVKMPWYRYGDSLDSDHQSQRGLPARSFAHSLLLVLHVLYSRRNSFEDSGPPFTELQQEPLEMDPPLAIPTDLRPLGAKRRYLRTVQLLADPQPAAVSPLPQAELALGVAGSDRVVPFEETLRRHDRGPGARYMLQKANSQSTLPVTGRAPTQRSPSAKSKPQLLTQEKHVSDDWRRSEGVDCAIPEEEDGGDEDPHTRTRDRAKSGSLESKPKGLLVCATLSLAYIRLRAWLLTVVMSSSAARHHTHTGPSAPHTSS